MNIPCNIIIIMMVHVCAAAHMLRLCMATTRDGKGTNRWRYAENMHLLANVRVMALRHQPLNNTLRGKLARVHAVRWDLS
jgi:hypothetical protein